MMLAGFYSQISMICTENVMKFYCQLYRKNLRDVVTQMD